MAERADAASRSTALRHARRDSLDALRCARRMPLLLPQALRLQGTSQWIAGKHSAAREYWGQSEQLAEKYGFVIECARTWLERGEKLGDAALVERAIEVFQRQGAQVFLATALHCQARLCVHSTGDGASARNRYARAIDALEAVKADHELVQARVAYAQLDGQ